MAVDTGPAVVDRKAARLSGRNGPQRGALVIDRFFETKQEALAWERAHPHFMTVRVVSERSSPRSRPDPLEQMPKNLTRVAQTKAPAPIAHRENDFAIAVVFETPERQLISAPPSVTFKATERALMSAPPSYHRRRFAADESEEINLPPLDWTARPVKRSRFV